MTEAAIRARLAQHKKGVTIVPEWIEVEYLLGQISDLRDALREAGADLRLMESNLARLEAERNRTNWL